MFADITEETCTGTGATLALAGATTGNLPFSVSFADGDLVAYFVEDSGGSIKAAGIGTYVSATDDITRNDLWNYNGTVVDKNPSTNITLSGGTHTVRCAIFSRVSPNPAQEAIPVSGFSVKAGNGSFYSQVFGAFAANTIYYMPFTHVWDQSYTTLGFEVSTAVAGNCRVGIYSCGSDGLPDKLIVDSGALSTGATGVVEGTVTEFYLPKGQYWAAMLSDAAFDPIAANLGVESFYPTISSTDESVTLCHLSISQTYGALPDPATVGAFTENTTRAMLVYLK